jgi:hypothetical protein
MEKVTITYASSQVKMEVITDGGAQSVITQDGIRYVIPLLLVRSEAHMRAGLRWREGRQL